MAAASAALPDPRLEPFPCGVFVGEHVHKLDDGNAFAVGFAGGFMYPHDGYRIHN